MLTVDRIRGHSFISDLIPEGDGLIVDLGMNRGQFSSETQRRFGCKVIGVEANPSLVQAIEPSERLRPLNYAVGDAAGEVSFYIDPLNSEASSLTPGPGARMVSVPCISLPDLLRAEDIRKIDLLKIDIEGAEIGLLRSTPAATLLLARQISVEFHAFLHPRSRPAIRSVLARLRGIGFIAIDFSRTYEDVLLINRHATRLSTWARASLLVQKYKLGIRRKLGSRLRAIPRPGRSSRRASARR